MVRNNLRTIIPLFMLTILLLNIPFVRASERHVNEVEEGDVGELVKSLEELLRRGEVRDVEELYRMLDDILDSLRSGDVEGVERGVSQLREYLRSNPSEVEGLSTETLWDILTIASWNVTSTLKISVDPEKLLELLKHIRLGEGGNLTSRDTAELLREMANLLGSGGIGDKFREAAELLERGKYLEAQKAYEEAVKSLTLNLDELASEGVDVDSVLEVLSKIPRDFSVFGESSGVEVGGGGRLNAYLPSLPQPRLVSPEIPPPPQLPRVSLETLLEASSILFLLVGLVFTLYYFRSSITSNARMIRERIALSSLKRGATRFGGLERLIVEIYNRAVALLGRSMPKYPYETPREYLGRFEGREAYKPLNLLTRIYEKAVYSGKEVSREDYEEALKAYEKLLERRSVDL